MALLVNWFEVRFDRKDFDLPYVDCATWEESTEVLESYVQTETVRTRLDVFELPQHQASSRINKCSGAN